MSVLSDVAAYWASQARTRSRMIQPLRRIVHCEGCGCGRYNCESCWCQCLNPNCDPSLHPLVSESENEDGSGESEDSDAEGETTDEGDDLEEPYYFPISRRAVNFRGTGCDEPNCGSCSL